ncbi:hypothetical protein Q4W49_004008 [Salmonella enterica]|nr:hypothetical protein [Salmonella enterica]EDE9382018.1 hypothetical protein [Salmonella enterica subsp. enterica serovar Enteritidis]EAU1634943.1 hypothetical protein [Salmonella enterica]EAW6170268.1 hypothetical protein [Salmonella enterica]EBJ6632181.1 hypothetical protein [Salmonella enterica]
MKQNNTTPSATTENMNNGIINPYQASCVKCGSPGGHPRKGKKVDTMAFPVFQPPAVPLPWDMLNLKNMLNALPLMK